MSDFFGDPTSTYTVSFSSDSSVGTPRLFNVAPSAEGALPPHPFLQTFCPPSAHFVSPPFAISTSPHVSRCFLYQLLLLP